MSALTPQARNDALRLKNEGNTLYLLGEHQAAYDKCSEAIQLDGSNAILYANRAAASLSLARYVISFVDSDAQDDSVIIDDQFCY